MDFIQGQDVSLSIDMDELGVRPWNWIETTKDIDDPLNDYFGKKPVEFAVYSADLQFTTDGKKLTSDEDDSSMSDDTYEVDPETGEKIYHQTTLVSNTPLSPPTDKWIEEYLANIESSSDHTFPPITTANNTEFLLEDLPFSFLEDTHERTDSDWFSSVFNLDENSDSIMFTDPIETKTHQIPTTASSAIDVLSSDETNKESTLFNSFIDEELSTSNSSNNSRSYSSHDFFQTKLEKIDPDESSMSSMIMARRTSIRSINQGQQDEEALRRFNIPLALEDITQSTTEEYNRHLVRLNHLSSEQIHVIKDIRRRGKNKVAAQNCRKRKAVSVDTLSEEVDELKRIKHELEERKRAYERQIAETRYQYEYLHREVLPDRQLPPAITVK